ncbi:sensor histidine kinase [Actinoplanes friuliensis]|uniref:histidine kinase n=1 Tax=Actinoplanes friuliensis DSM 7358 TaxID=1246995 RepID=U5WBS8_9ACTN|nr:sensor histidine kinase [Actinoplanes friuliensis]AGZ46643.1 putative sensor-like histidine kinase [Actinoplanes friuliensis DSM 7358]
MLFGRFRILGKLTLLVLVPLIGVIALAVPIVVNRVDAARDAQKTSDAVELATQVGSAVQELQEERLLSVGYLFGLVQAPELVVQSARATDRITGLKHLDQPISAGLRAAVDDLKKLDSTRAGVINRTIRPDLIVTEFTAVITPIINALALAQNADLTTSSGRQIYALEQALRSDDMISQASGYLTSAVVTKNAGLVGLFYSTLVQLQLIIINAQPYFTDTQYKLYLGAQEAFASRVGNRFLTEAATNPESAVKLLNIQTLFPSLRSVIVLGGFVEKRVAADVDVAVTRNRDSALRTAGYVGGGALVLLLLVIALSLLMARAVARPLRRLTFSADRIARAAEAELERVADDDAEHARPIRLDPVDVQARDEIGDLARAFDRVQTTAARLVERQVLGRRNVAQMFGHVGRRTQNLVGRQLALIDNLERRETDSDRLRELYRLDHMSSRLRRNASSLVVLSGAVGANDHMAPLALSDVVRLALGEIEDYTRVDVDVPEEIVVVPAVLADLTLLLAELMENATSFSPPHTRVTVTAAELRGGARLAIIDQGLGLAPERLAEENARLTRRERLDLAPSEVLGLFVVGRLARRHGIEVTLTDTPEGGVTAWIDLGPAHLVAPREPLPGMPAGPIHATVPSHHTEFTPLIAGTSGRSVPGSAQPFDANVLHRATKTLEAGRSWNAFAPVRAGTPALEAGPSSYHEQQPAYEVPAAYDTGTPVAGRFPAAPELPSAGRYTEPEPPMVVEGPIVMSAPPDAIQIPHQRTAPEAYQRPPQPQRFEAPVPPNPVPQQRTSPETRNGSPSGPLRRRVPGNQLPVETGPKLPATPPTSDDALAAREAFDAFEAGVSRAQWDVIEQDMSSPPAAGHPPLTRRVPGATLPVTDPPMNPVPVASPAQPLDPEAARASMEQFEFGVARALSETQPLPEGQPR